MGGPWVGVGSKAPLTATAPALVCALADSQHAWLGTHSAHPVRRSRQAITPLCKDTTMGLGTILLIILILMLVGAFPTWPHSRNWGYGPSGGLGLVVIILIVLLLMGRI
jgi:hypothetical protein